MMQYKGYTGLAEVDTEAGLLIGRVIGLRDVITFQAETPRKLVEEFQRSVDFYLDFCASRGESPERPYSGNFQVRLDRSLHRALALAAEARGQSLNAFVAQTLTDALQTLETNPPNPQRSRPPSTSQTPNRKDPRTKRAGTT